MEMNSWKGGPNSDLLCRRKINQWPSGKKKCTRLCYPRKIFSSAQLCKIGGAGVHAKEAGVQETEFCSGLPDFSLLGEEKRRAVHSREKVGRRGHRAHNTRFVLTYDTRSYT